MNSIKVKLVNPDGSEVRKLWRVLHEMTARGFQARYPEIKSGPLGMFLCAVVVYVQEFRIHGEDAAFEGLLSALEAGCTTSDLIPA
ncbi:hypothetical protein [Burkholderia vietnamiensis]|uniref:hypothetical protein n=1 Tax=Burkholderia vietnamiensis TaxID=60552 RepID=UPI000B1FD31B|nr:hypothetical protein [Burkholderia vietnamiensis]